MTAQYTKKVLVRDIANYFSLEQITGDKTSLERWVVVADMNNQAILNSQNLEEL